MAAILIKFLIFISTSYTPHETGIGVSMVVVICDQLRNVIKININVIK